MSFPIGRDEQPILIGPWSRSIETACLGALFEAKICRQKHDGSTSTPVLHASCSDMSCNSHGHGLPSDEQIINQLLIVDEYGVLYSVPFSL